MTRRTTTTLVLSLATAVSLLPMLPASGQEPETEIIWKQFIADRSALYEKLAPPFVECFKRRDSAVDPLSPIFHGCIDWHSAVHAAYSHHALYHRTGASAYLDLVEQQIAPQGISLVPAEQVYEQAKAPDFPLTENPYGFGWFLILARERQLSTGKTDMRQMADYAADMMIDWFETRAERGDARAFITDRAHANYSWSLINLDVWGRYTNDAAILSAVRKASAPLFAPALDNSCPATTDTSPTASGFQPACLMRLAAVAHIWGEQVTDWVAARLPEGFHVPPLTDPSGCHQGGLNFSRSFALYQLYLATGNTDLRDNYVELIRYHVGRPDLYIDPDYLGDPGYLCYSHWVAQFGVRSISLSFEGRPPTPGEEPPWPAPLPPAPGDPAATIASPTDGAVISRNATPNLQVEGTVAFDAPEQGTQALSFDYRPGAPEGWRQLRFEATGQPADTVFTCNIVSANDVCGEKYGYQQLDGLPLTLDASRPFEGTLVLRNDRIQGIPGAGRPRVEFTLTGTIGGATVILGTDSQTYVMLPTEPRVKVDFRIQPDMDLDKQDLNALHLSVWIREVTVLHGAPQYGGTSTLREPIYTAGFDRRVEVSIDDPTFKAPTAADLGPNLTSFSATIPTPSVGQHTIYVRAVHGARASETVAATIEVVA